MKELTKYLSLSPIGVMRYSGRFLLRPESVPDHMSQCITLAIGIVEDLRSLGVEVDLKDLIYRVSIHDLPEALTSDIVRPFKYHHKELTKEINRAEHEILIDYNISRSVISDIENAKDSKSIEGCLMRYLDILQVVLKCHEEVNILGNRSMMPVLTDALSTMSNVTEKISDLYGHVFDNYINNLTKKCYELQRQTQV